jgi:hypothetical protein
MRVLMLPFAPRFILYTTAVAGTVSLALLALWQPALLPFLSVLIGVFACFAVLGTVDLLQTRHAVLRNYPISAHLRFMLEKIRPEMRQYFFEDEKHGLPFSGTNARSSINAPRTSWIRGRSARNMTYMPTASSGCATPLLLDRMQRLRFGFPSAAMIARCLIAHRSSTSRP